MGWDELSLTRPGKWRSVVFASGKDLYVDLFPLHYLLTHQKRFHALRLLTSLLSYQEEEAPRHPSS